MSGSLHRTETRPKSITAIEQAVFNNAPASMELMRYKYRKLFHLSAEELEKEPIDQFFTNLYIYAQIQKKEELINKHGQRKY